MLKIRKCKGCGSEVRKKDVLDFDTCPYCNSKQVTWVNIVFNNNSGIYEVQETKK